VIYEFADVLRIVRVNRVQHRREVLSMKTIRNPVSATSLPAVAGDSFLSLFGASP